MSWSYSGDPSLSEKDKYRFLIKDTDPSRPILQDEEILFILCSTEDETVRLQLLFESAADLYAKNIKRSLGPQSEDPSSMINYYRDRAEYYRKLVAQSSGFPTICKTKPSFAKGMHDNVC